MTKNGILCETETGNVFLDPKKTDLDGVNFVSHAHSDHLPSKNGGTILSSIETNEISGIRGFTMENHIESLDGFSLIDSGHVLGSADSQNTHLLIHFTSIWYRILGWNNVMVVTVGI